MTILWFIIISIIAGWIAGELTKGTGFGLLGNLVVGVIGAILGGMIFDLKSDSLEDRWPTLPFPTHIHPHDV